VCALLERYRRAGIRVAVWDITSDLGVAAFHAAIVESTVDPFRRVGRAYGFGCHADRGVALCRALCEAAQSRLTRIVGSRDDISHEEFEEPPSVEKILEQQAELDAYGAPARSFEEVSSIDLLTFEDDLRWTSRRLEGAGLGPLAFVELSPPELPFSVVRVVIPGLEGVPAIPGYVPGLRARAAERAGSA
jgi:ribosomal protein S12 methylthiotransferase accessory factor